MIQEVAPASSTVTVATQQASHSRELDDSQDGGASSQPIRGLKTCDDGQIPLMQERLLAQQVSSKKDLSKAIAKAKRAYMAGEDKTRVAVEAQQHNSSIRGAFVVFQRCQFSDDVTQTAPTGAMHAQLLRPALSSSDPLQTRSILFPAKHIPAFGPSVAMPALY